MTSKDNFSHLDPLLRRGIELFNQGEYFECHEVLEELWNTQADPERQFTQGLIQLAVALHHLRNDNLEGATKLLARALERLRRFPLNHQRLNVCDLIVEAESVLANIESRSQSFQSPSIRSV